MIEQSTSRSEPALSCSGVAKSFGGVPVLTGVSLRLMPGTVTALAGENGAGKSTLLKILAGQVHPDAGEVSVASTRVGDHYGPARARALGVGIVPQELAPVPDLTVYENLFLGRELRSGGLLRRRAMVEQAGELLDAFDVDLDPRAVVRRLPVAMQQILEIVKNSSWGARVLLLDEPTSAISSHEVAQLYRIIERLKSQGVAMVYTTHKMEEIRAVSDRVVVLRDGALVSDGDTSAITDDGIVSAMIGRDLQDLFPASAQVPSLQDAPVLEVCDVLVPPALAPVSLSVRRGEILALAGLVGAGRTELLEALFGVRRRTAGTVRVNGDDLPRDKPAEAIRRGLALVPEDRKGAGLVLGMSVLDNGSLPHLGRFSAFGWLRNGRRHEAVSTSMQAMTLRSRGLRQSVATLSGGNQQKVVLGRWLSGTVDVLLLDEPTRGVDVGARSEIYRNITSLAQSGLAVVMASSDMAEVLGLAHRVAVLRGGTVVGELAGDDLRREDAPDRIFRLAAGLDDAAPLARR